MFNLRGKFDRRCHVACFVTVWEFTSLTTLLWVLSCTKPGIMFDSLKVVDVAMGFNERVIDGVFRSCQLYIHRLIPLRETTAVDCERSW